MHPSVLAASEAQRPRRVARKRERRASCSAASQPSQPSLTYQIPSLSRMERRSSHNGSVSLPFGSSNPALNSHSSHCRMERRSSCSSTASLSDSYSSIRSMDSASSTKSCSFAEDALVIRVPSAASQIDNHSDLWYQKADFDAFREKTRRIINNVDENGRGKNGKKYCTRGLEKYMAQRRNLRNSILQALDEDETSASNGSAISQHTRGSSPSPPDENIKPTETKKNGLSRIGRRFSMGRRRKDINEKGLSEQMN